MKTELITIEMKKHFHIILLIIFAFILLFVTYPISLHVAESFGIENRTIPPLVIVSWSLRGDWFIYRGLICIEIFIGILLFKRTSPLKNLAQFLNKQ